MIHRQITRSKHMNYNERCFCTTPTRHFTKWSPAHIYLENTKSMLSYNMQYAISDTYVFFNNLHEATVNILYMICCTINVKEQTIIYPVYLPNVSRLFSSDCIYVSTPKSWEKDEIMYSICQRGLIFIKRRIHIV